MPPLMKEELWSSGQDEDVEVNQRALIDSEVISFLPPVCRFTYVCV